MNSTDLKSCFSIKVRKERSGLASGPCKTLFFFSFRSILLSLPVFALGFGLGVLSRSIVEGLETFSSTTAYAACELALALLA